MPDLQTEAQKQAAALEALRHGPPPKSGAATFWQQHGGKLIATVALLLGLWLLARLVGSFMHTSIAETERTQEELRRGMGRR